jgi:hypothetical protein
MGDTFPKVHRTQFGHEDSSSPNARVTQARIAAEAKIRDYFVRAVFIVTTVVQSALA